jgi:hypothetical protein
MHSSILSIGTAIGYIAYISLRRKERNKRERRCVDSIHPKLKSSAAISRYPIGARALPQAKKQASNRCGAVVVLRCEREKEIKTEVESCCCGSGRPPGVI